MTFVFRLVEGHCNCEGCAIKIKNYVKNVHGVESAKVERKRDENGDYGVTLIAKGRFDPDKIILGVEIKTKKVIELVSSSDDNGKVSQVEPTKVKHPSTPVAKIPKDLPFNFDRVKDPSAPVAKFSKDLSYDCDGIDVEPWKKKLGELASNNLGKAHKLKDLVDECGDLKVQLANARARQDELWRKKQDILNHVRPNPSLPQRSRGREPKKKEESEVLYGKLARQEIKLDDFVQKYKRIRIKEHERMNNHSCAI